MKWLKTVTMYSEVTQDSGVSFDSDNGQWSNCGQSYDSEPWLWTVKWLSAVNQESNSRQWIWTVKLLGIMNDSGQWSDSRQWLQPGVTLDSEMTRDNCLRQWRDSATIHNCYWTLEWLKTVNLSSDSDQWSDWKLWIWCVSEMVTQYIDSERWLCPVKWLKIVILKGDWPVKWLKTVNFKWLWPVITQNSESE